MEKYNITKKNLEDIIRTCKKRIGFTMDIIKNWETTIMNYIIPEHICYTYRALYHILDNILISKKCKQINIDIIKQLTKKYLLLFFSKRRYRIEILIIFSKCAAIIKKNNGAKKYVCFINQICKGYKYRFINYIIFFIRKYEYSNIIKIILLNIIQGCEQYPQIHHLVEIYNINEKIKIK
jgi:hypothetical protein